MATSVADLIDHWREQLADWSSQNPLLSLPDDNPYCLTITQPSIGELFTRMLAGKRYSFESGGDDPVITCADLAEDTLAKRLTRLHHRTQQVLLDRASTGLYLVGGILVWTDDDDELHRSPLVMLPVELTRESVNRPFQFHAEHQEPMVNPALAARLKRDFDLRLPTLPQPDANDFLETYFQELESAVADIDGRLELTAHLMPAALQRYFAYQVYQQHSEAIRRHPFVQVLAGEKSAKTLSAAPAPQEAELDSMEHTESLPVLDVDGRQHLCLEAAARGHQFLVHSPPGTGHRQTITNLIAGCLAKGKTVLFVSPKRSALEEVRLRLQKLQLDDYCLPMYRLTSGSPLKSELQSCLKKAGEIREHEELPPLDWTKWIAYRLRLNGYVTALHAIREPLMRSIWSALDELAGWDELPVYPVGMPLSRHESQGSDDMPVVAEIGLGWIEEAMQSVKRLQELWHLRPPTKEGEGADQPDSPWFGLKADRYTNQLRDDLLGLIDRVLSRLKRLAKVAKEFAEPLSLPTNVSWLLHFANLLDARPAEIPVSWLQDGDPEALEKELANCEAKYQARAQGRAPLTERYGEDIWSVSEGTADRVHESWQTASLSLAAENDKGKELLAHQQNLRGWAADTQQRIPNWISDLRVLEKWLGVPVPLGAEPDPQNKVDPSPDEVRRYMRLVHLCQSDHPPERPWVHKNEELESAKKLIAEQRPIFEKLNQRRAQLLATYDESIFELELGRIVGAFEGPYQSKLRVFNSQFRKDRRAIKRRAKGEAMPPTYVEDMKEAHVIQKERDKIDREREQRKAVLGRYEKGFDTDFDEVERATRIAAEVVDLVQELGCESLPARLLDALCSVSKPSSKIRAAAKRLHDSFGEWHHATVELKNVLPMKRLPETDQPLDASALSNLLHYSKELQGRLNQFASLTDPFLVRAPKPPEDVATLVSDLRAAEEFLTSEETQPTEEEKWKKRFGPKFQGVKTDWKALRKQVKWAKQIHRSFAEAGEKPSQAFGNWLAGESTSAVSTKDLRHAYEQYQHALHSLEHRFDKPGPLHEGKPLGQHDPDIVRKHLVALRDRMDELPAWIDWRVLPVRFGGLGLGAFWEALLEKNPPREQLVDLFQKSFWHHWVEAMCQSDEALKKFQSTEHQRIWKEYCELDQGVLDLNARRVAIEASTHRNHALQKIAEEEKQAISQKKGTTVVRLMESAPQLVQGLKPCILATPEWVGRALPAEKYGADMVIVDEASLFTPAEVSCLFFRGKQVLCFGDEQQLHPAFTDPTEEAAEMTAVQESVVETASAKGVWRLELTHQYRSEHERLIAFSNVQYYGQRLWTFPQSDFGETDFGLHVCQVANGMVDGRERINAAEVEQVVKLVAEHANRNTDRSLGVVTATTAQAHAVWESLIEQATQNKTLGQWLDGQSADTSEPFFVTEVDLAQSEVRDVMILSTVLAKQRDQQWPADFLGWSHDQGGRRLNVAVTGARKRLTVVTSCSAKDIAPESNVIDMLHAFLTFAEQEADQPPNGLRRVEQPSRLQQVIMDALKEMGRQSVADVGWGAHPLDIAALDEKHPKQYALGIELDGPAYHETPTARDRDRIRPAVMRKRGWRLHRVSSLGWWKDRETEMKLLAKSLEESNVTHEEKL